MKKIIITTLLLISVSVASALQLQIVRASFDSSTAITPGSTQWVDIIIVSSGNSSDSVKLWIQYTENGFNYGLPEVVFKERYWYEFRDRPAFPDSSRRVTFNLPISPIKPKFKIQVNLAPTIAFGVFNIITSVSSNYTERQIHSVDYITLNGQKLQEPQGYCLRRVTYTDGSSTCSQVIVLQ